MRLYGGLSIEEFRGLVKLVKGKVMNMPDHSVIWVPEYSAEDVAQLTSMVLSEEGRGHGDRVEFHRGKIILGKDYPLLKCSNSKDGDGIIICPNCYEKDKKRKKFTKYAIIRTDKGMKLQGKDLELTCKECSHKIILEPNEVVKLKYGKLNVHYII